MMGSGKSSVGLALSARTGWPFVDNDALVELATGRTARQLLAEAGEGPMRAAESAALRSALRIDPPVIVAAAAGAILEPDDREILREPFVAWLRAPAEVLAARAVGAEHRPWLDDDPVGWFRRTSAARDPLYAAVADVTVDSSVTGPDAAADAILAAASSRG
jgi:shikimate kinase